MIIKQTENDETGFRLAKETTVEQTEKDAKKSNKSKSETILPHMELTK